MSPFRNNVQPPQNGEPVNAQVAGRSLSKLLGNTQHLKEIVDNLLRPSGVYLYGQAVASTTAVGTPVYWDEDNVRYAPAKLTLEWVSSQGVVQFSPQSKVVGIVVAKDASTIGTVMIAGYGELDTLSTILDSSDLGDFSLSTTTAGEYEATAQAGQPVILRRTTATGFFFYPIAKSFETAHSHVVFDLTCAPAGTYTPPSPGDPHEITAGDDELPGWLPADDASFSGNAPDGAKFGYNIAADSALSAWWPPAMPHSILLIWNKGLDVDQLGQVVQPGDNKQVVIDANGIWWMSDCYGDVPWPIDWQTGDSESDNEACPRELHMTMQLHGASFVMDTDPSLVSSLRSVDPRIKVYCRGTETEASTGPLDIDFEGSLLQNDLAEEGSLVFKEFDGTTLKRGHVVSGLFTNDEKVTLVGTESYVDDDDNEVQQGVVEISVADAATIELIPSVAKHAGTTIETEPVMYVGMPNGPSGDEISYVIYAFDIPTTFSGNRSFRLRSRIIGREAGTLPQLTVTYRIAPRPANGLVTPITAVGSWSSMTIVTVATLASSNQAVEATSNPVTVAAGDIIYVKVLRDAGAVSDAYAAELGIMQQLGLVTAS